MARKAAVERPRTPTEMDEAPALGEGAAKLFDGLDDRLLERFYRPIELEPGMEPEDEEVVAMEPRTIAVGKAPPVRVPRPTRAERAARAATEKPRPTHYKICCISLYTEDIQRLEALVAELKRRGHTKANKSQVIRAALDQLDINKVPKGY